MMSTYRNRKTETMVYIVLWLLVIGLFLLDIMRSRAQLSEPLIDMHVVLTVTEKILPFLILFLINNNVLIPRMLLRNRLTQYFAYTALAVVSLWIYQYFSFMHRMEMMPPEMLPHEFRGPVRPLLPLPLFLDSIYALLVVGGNLAVALMFQRFDDKLERESLMKTNAEHQLAYLKAQINPHFYMNMLNNIHGMIEIDPEKAQGMVIEMSELMRYMLYESSRQLIPLQSEVAFLRNYLNLMRQRYPENRVKITAYFPDDAAMAGKSIPPLLFLVFIENAFKHGVSYREESFISVKVGVAGTAVRFSCMNSNHVTSGDDTGRVGIGLRNISQRLELLYGQNASLDIETTSSTYTVNLTIQADDTENTDNR